MDCVPLDDVKISLDGFRCEGLVQYSINGGNRSGYFCAENFGKIPAQRTPPKDLQQLFHSSRNYQSNSDPNQVLQFLELK